MLLYSSCLFLLVSIVGILYTYYIYSLLFLFLMSTSILFYINNKYYLVDQLAILCCVFYGLYTFIQKFKLTIGSVIIMYTFIFCVILYYGGYYLQDFCYCKIYGNVWHFLVHVLTIIGHIGIIIL